MRVVLDTNVLFGDPVMIRDTSKRMLQLLYPARATLVFSPIVLGELNRQRSDDIEDLYAPTRSRIKKIAAMAGVDPAEFLAQTGKLVEAAEDRWSSRWREILSDPNVKVAPWPMARPQQMAERELARRRPFMDKDPGTIGHRDMLIWLGVVELAREDADDEILFVTSDNGFLLGAGLHPHLIEDLDQAGVPNSVTWLKSLPALVAALQKATETSGWDAWRETRVAELLYDEIQALGAQDFTEHWDDRDGGMAAPTFDLGLPFTGHEWNLDRAEGPQDLIFQEAAFGADELIATFVIELDLSGYMDKSEWYGDDHPELDLWDAGWNDHVVLIHATRHVRLRARFNIEDTEEFATFEEFLDSEVVGEPGAITLG